MLAPLLGRAAAYARSIFRNRHDAEDAVQQAALRGLERFDSFDPTRPFKGWWFAILRNCCIDTLRVRRAEKTESLGDHEAADTGTPEIAGWEQLSTAMEQLSQDHHEILRLRYFAGLSYQEMAVALAIAPGTVMSRLHLARKALAAKTSKEEP
ncbi:MAG TPA: sigma-70 family RNA polymerase sigma factor [Steroidobacteraceae bacterium]|jgi:RNA polymerase sigma-70 factor (ECF subfamily)